jgi:hypothetical protein
MVETVIVKKDEKEEVKSNQVEASKNGASFAPALDLRSTYQGVFGFPRFEPVMSISPPLRAAARSVYRDLWRASATTFSGAIGPFETMLPPTHTS